MEKIEIAALSKIADIITNSVSGPIIVEEDIWKKIFYNAEQGELFEKRAAQFKIVIKQMDYKKKTIKEKLNRINYVVLKRLNNIV